MEVVECLEGKSLISKVISLKAAGLKPRSPDAQARTPFFFWYHKDDRIWTGPPGREKEAAPHNLAGSGLA